jgi:hypothetical protein
MTITGVRAQVLFGCWQLALMAGCGDAGAPPTGKASLALDTVETTFVGPSAEIYGTFQSHNQKVVANEHGIFMTYVTSADAAYNEVTWRLARSMNGGASFDTVYEATDGTHPPVIETDNSGLIYLIHSDWWPGNDAYLKVFSPENDYALPMSETTLPDGAAQKFVMHLDEARDRIYYVANNLVPVDPEIQDSTVRFFALDLDGQLLDSYQLTTPGKSADAHYPLLALAENGDLYAAWTTVRLGESSYWSIHFMRSRNGGRRWERADGTPLTIPVVADESGPTDRINLDDELAPSSWLSNFLVKRGKAHFIYRADTAPPRQHYVRYDLATASIDINTYPDWSGETLSVLSQDGACATNRDRPDGPIYCIGERRDMPDGQSQHVVLSSTDNGTTWHDQDSGPVVDRDLYAVGAAREITPDGAMIGSYVETDWPETPEPSQEPSEVWFYRVPVEVPGPSRLPAAVTASVAHPSGLPAKAGDSDFVSLFAASMSVATANNGAWVLIDLGAEKNVSALKWKGAAGTPYPLHSPAAYAVEVSNDGVTWTEVASHAGGAGVVDGNEAIGQVARYVRLVTTQVNDGTGWALGLYEIWVEGTDLAADRFSAVGTASMSAVGHPASNATDADDTTSWVASLVPGGSNNDAWFALDFGKVKRIDNLQWQGASGIPYPAHSPTDYTIEVSNDGASWAPIVARDNDAAVLIGDEPIGQSWRFVRIATTQVNDGTGWSLGFHEIWANGIDVPTFRMPAFVIAGSAAPGYPAANAVDGAAASLWMASSVASPANNSARIQLDLGKVRRVHRLLWKGATGTPYPASSPADYTVRISTNGSTWTTVADRTNPAGVSDGNELIEQDARYVRLTTTKVGDGTGWALGMHELWAE